MSDTIVFERGEGGLGRPALGEDHISGFVFYHSSLPSGFASDDRVKQIFTLSEAEDLGIVDTGGDGTAASGDTTISDIGSDGDKITFKVNRGSGRSKVNLGTYEKVSGDSDATAVATAVAELINANTDVHGYSASSSTADITITAPAKDGDDADSYTVEISKSPSGSSFAITGGTFSGGSDGYIDVLHYQISEFFRVRDNIAEGSTGVYVGIFDEPGGSHDFEEVRTLQRQADGKIRQVGVVTKEAFASADVTQLHTVCDSLADSDMPIVALYGPDFSAVSDLTGLDDLTALEAERVSVVLGQDGKNVGALLYDLREQSMPAVGAALGSLSAAAVNESIAWTGKFNLVTGRELDVPAYGEGSLVKDEAEGLVTQLKDKGYLLLYKEIGLSGTYFRDSRTSISETSDYFSIENVRAMDKAVRGIRQALLPYLRSPILIDADKGQIQTSTIGVLQNACNRPLERMEALEELSGFRVTIDPQQDVQSTGEIVIVIKKVPVGVARKFRVKVGYTTSLS